MSLMMGSDGGVSAFPEGDNIFQWTGTIAGGAGTVSYAQYSRSTPAHPRTPTSLAKQGPAPGRCCMSPRWFG